MSQVKTYTRERDAKYAARKAGLVDGQYTTKEIDGRWAYVEKKVRAAKADRVPAEPKTAPEGKRAEIVALCRRKEGATRAELIDLTGWSKAPWKWLLSNPQGTGICDRYGYGLKVEHEGRNSRYFVTA